MSNRLLNVVILAAGKGNRMFSSFPKVMHLLAGKALVQHVIDTATQLNAERIFLVYGYGGELLRQHLVDQVTTINWVLQIEQKGTGHAVQQTIQGIHDEEDVLILYGDVPLISSDTLQRLLIERQKDNISLLTVTMKNPEGYGRIVRLNGEVVSIVEQQDATEKQKHIKEINTGILVANSGDLKHWLQKLSNNNAQNELYLTDIIALAYHEGRKINTVHPSRHSEIQGVNNRLQLAHLERTYQREKAEQLLLSGVMLSDPNRFDLRGDLYHGQDISIDTNVILEGRVILGNKVKIGTGCILKNSIIGDNVIISPYTIIENASIEAYSTIGPFARLRTGSVIQEGAHVGNFVEIKEARLGKKSKAGHLSYLGDAEIGENVNIGAGTITCNYDGAQKHKTVIGDDVFIGSSSQLIAPITIRRGATIGAGTSVTCDVNEGDMVISRIRQFPIGKWKRQGKNNQDSDTFS